MPAFACARVVCVGIGLLWFLAGWIEPSVHRRTSDWKCVLPCHLAGEDGVCDPDRPARSVWSCGEIKARASLQFLQQQSMRHDLMLAAASCCAPVWCACDVCCTAVACELSAVSVWSGVLNGCVATLIFMIL